MRRTLDKQLTNQRGSLLIVALLVMLALASLGLIMVQKVNLEQTLTGNERRGTVAFHVTEGGTYAAYAWSESMGDSGFLTMMNTTITNGGQPTWIDDDFVPATDFYDMTEAGSFGYEGFILDSAAAANPTLGAPFDFEVSIGKTGMSQPVMGYSATGVNSKCRYTYQFDTDGNISAGSSSQEEEFKAWKRIRVLKKLKDLCTGGGGVS